MVNIALIVAAGRGSRFNSTIPKQYQKINNISLLEKSIISFYEIVDYIQVAIHPDDILLYNEIATKYKLPPPVYGGASRQKSVKNGLENIAYLNPKNVLIHDAARPHVSKKLIRDMLESLKTHKGVIPGVRATDSIKQVIDGKIVKSLDRNQIYLAQTPQGFDFQTIYDAHLKSTLKEATDDAVILEEFGIEMTTLESDASNFKITYQGDIKMRETRVGIGFDVHRFSDVPKRDYITIAGVKIPFEKSIEAHSDGDVVLHALTDALLGTIGEGDIGIHFPDNDPLNKNRDSSEFVKFACSLLEAKNATILNIDVTIIAQKPKFSKYREEMKLKLAEILAIDASRVNIKATTTENLGFTGREEGIAAQAIANIML
jgi:2-C-methyl-D-erythritol 4-phosphate cytidylyltransferase/2-C-methyl-D-erythritol 2,4-cyclodiphosphate synthase